MGSGSSRSVMVDTDTRDAAEQAPFDALPDELVLAVFVWLPWWDLLRGPAAVCRRWRRLARDASFWSGQSNSYYSERKTLAVLCFAPVLHSLHYNGHPWMQLARAAQETDCAVTELHITLSFIPTRSRGDNAGIFGMFLPTLFRRGVASFYEVDLRTGLSQYDEAVIALLRRQVALGRLRRFRGFGIQERMVRELVSTALQAPLTQLDIYSGYSNHNEHPAGSKPSQPQGLPHSPSLQTLRYNIKSQLPDLRSFIPEALVSAHAASLRSVALLGVSARAVTLLSQCPQLRAAELQLMPALASICSLPLLTELTLALGEDGPPLMSFSFFRSAIQLTKLTLRSNPTLRNISDLDLFMELGKSGQSNLMQLHIENFYCGLTPAERGAIFVRLEEVLPESGFPLLQELYLENVPSADVLERIAPRLRVLSFEAVFWDTNRCLCPACCYPAFPRLVAQHPRLHVLSVPTSHECVLGQCCSLYAHGEREECGVDHGRAGTSEWRLVTALLES